MGLDGVEFGEGGSRVAVEGQHLLQVAAVVDQIDDPYDQLADLPLLVVHRHGTGKNTTTRSVVVVSILVCSVQFLFFFFLLESVVTISGQPDNVVRHVGIRYGPIEAHHLLEHRFRRFRFDVALRVEIHQGDKFVLIAATSI